MAYNLKRNNYAIRIIMWSLAVFAAFLLVLLLVQYLKIMDMRKYIPGKLDSNLPSPDWQSMELLDKDRLDRLFEANDQRQEELDILSKNLDEQQVSLEELQKLVEKERKSIEEEKKKLTEQQKLYDKKRETMIQTSRELTQMDENVAIEILQKRDNEDIIWIMAITDEIAAEEGSFSLVPTWLELMDPSRAAEIQRERDLIPDTLE